MLIVNQQLKKITPNEGRRRASPTNSTTTTTTTTTTAATTTATTSSSADTLPLLLPLPIPLRYYHSSADNRSPLDFAIDKQSE
jgi:hypothetical protein